MISSVLFNSIWKHNIQTKLELIRINRKILCLYVYTWQNLSILFDEVVTLNKKWILIVCLALFVFFGSMGVAYWYTRKNVMPEEKADTLEFPALHQALVKEDTIAEDAHIVYQYYYTEDAVTKEKVEPVQNFQKGLTLAQLQSIYDGWQVISFSPQKVILRCSVEGRSDACFLLGAYQGYLAVFQEDMQKRFVLYEQTDIPLAALPLAEQQKLKDGVVVMGEVALAKMLSDYSS